MKVLYIDTTTADLVVAIITENDIFDFSRRDCGMKHSETLCEKVAEAMASYNLDWSDLDAYAVAVGPGSFTGIRIGIATVKGYNAAVVKPLISINCLHAIALSEKSGAKGCAVIDAGNGYYYGNCDYVFKNVIAYDDELALQAGKASGGADYIDGAAKIVRDRYFLKQFSDSLEPLYIRKSQAEINKLK